MNFENKQFSEREKDVIGLLLQGKSNKQIALELGISRRTVEFHLSNVYAKLGVNSRSEAILKLTENHLREFTGGSQVISTVDNSVDSTENGLKSFLRRIAMKKTYYLIGGLCAATLIVILTVIDIRPPTAEVPPTELVEQIPATQNSVPTVTKPPATESVPLQPANPVIPPHTVNGYTASIESHYVDVSHVIFNVRITGGDISFGDEHFYDRLGSLDLYDENGNLINSSGGWGPAIDPTVYQVEFVPQTLFKGGRVKGQFAFDLRDAPDYNKILAQFRFDFDLPIYPEERFYPKQTVTANGLEMLLDSVTVTPTYTQAYLCFEPPSYAPWNIGSKTMLQIEGQEAGLYNFRNLFNADTGGDRRAGSEPYWVPPTKRGSCIKVGFPIGSSDPTSLTLTIPELEKMEPDILMTDQLLMNYPGLNEKEAYYKYLEEHGNIYKGPWIFSVELAP